MSETKIYKVFDAETVNATATAYSDAIPINRSTGVFSVQSAVTGSGAEVTLSYQVSHHPELLGWGEATEIDTLLGNTSEVNAFTPPVANWLRLVATGTGANPADAAITATVAQVIAD